MTVIQYFDARGILLSFKDDRTLNPSELERLQEHMQNTKVDPHLRQAESSTLKSISSGLTPEEIDFLQKNTDLLDNGLTREEAKYLQDLDWVLDIFSPELTSPERKVILEYGLGEAKPAVQRSAQISESFPGPSCAVEQPSSVKPAFLREQAVVEVGHPFLGAWGEAGLLDNPTALRRASIALEPASPSPPSAEPTSSPSTSPEGSCSWINRLPARFRRPAVMRCSKHAALGCRGDDGRPLFPPPRLGRVVGWMPPGLSKCLACCKKYFEFWDFGSREGSSRRWG
jgi:hypothetical protein